MKKKLIRLTESDLHRIVRTVVNRLLNESSTDKIYADGEPDYFDIMSGDTFIGACNYESDDALPFIICNGQLFKGRFGYGHGSCNAPTEANKCDDYAAGRIWFKVNQHPHSDNDEEYDELNNEIQFPFVIVAFWYEEKEHTINSRVVDDLLSSYGINKNNALFVSFNENDYGAIYPYDEWHFKISKANERQKEIRAIHLMNGKDKYDATSDFRGYRDRLIGKKLTNSNGVEMPLAQYRNMIYAENKNIH